MHETVTVLPAADIRSQLDGWLWDADVPLALLVNGNCLEEIVVPYLQNHRQKNRGIVFALESERETSFSVAEAIAAVLNDDEVLGQLLDTPPREWPLIWRENFGEGKENGGIHHVLMVESIELLAQRPPEERVEFMALLFALAAAPGLSVVLMIEAGSRGLFEGIPEMEKLDFSSTHPVQSLAKAVGPAPVPLPATSPEIPEMTAPVQEKESRASREKIRKDFSPAFLAAAVFAAIGAAVAVHFNPWEAASLQTGSALTVRQAVLAASGAVPITETESTGFASPPEAWTEPEAEVEPMPEFLLPAEETEIRRPAKAAPLLPLEIALSSRHLEIINLPNITGGIKLPIVAMTGNSDGLPMAWMDPIETGVWKMPERAPAVTVTTGTVETRPISQAGLPSLKLDTDFLETVSFAPLEIPLPSLSLPVSLTLEMRSPQLEEPVRISWAKSLFPGGPGGGIEPMFPRKPEKKPAPRMVSAVLKRFKTQQIQSAEGLRQAYASLTTTEPDSSSREMEEWLDQIDASPETFDREVALAFRQSGDLESAFAWFYKWARRSDEAESLFEVGAAKFLGLGTPRNASLAIPYLFRAWQSGDGEAGYLYGVAQLFGWGLPRNEANAFATFQEACQLGSSRPYREMARMCELGAGVPRDLNAARSFYHNGAEKADAYCLRRLAEMGGPVKTMRQGDKEIGGSSGPVTANRLQVQPDPVHEAVLQLHSGDFYTRRK